MVTGQVDLASHPTTFLPHATRGEDEVLVEYPIDGDLLIRDLLQGVSCLGINLPLNFLKLVLKTNPCRAKSGHQPVEHSMAHHRIEITVGLVHVLIDAAFKDVTGHAGDIIVHVEEAAGNRRFRGLVVQAGFHNPDVGEEDIVPPLLHLSGIAIIDVAPDGQPGSLPELAHFLLGESNLVFPTLVDPIRLCLKLLKAGDGGGCILRLHQILRAWPRALSRSANKLSRVYSEGFGVKSSCLS